MANEQNLKPITTLSKEEAKRRGKKGGKASGEARRKRKSMKEQMDYLLSLPLQESNLKQSLELMGIDTSEMNLQMAMNVAMVKTALSGGVNAYNSIRELMGERVQELKVTQVTDDNIDYIKEYLDARKQK